MRGRAAGLVAVLLAATLARWLPLPPPPAPPDPRGAIRAAPLARWLPLPPPPAPPDPQSEIHAAPVPDQDMRNPTQPYEPAIAPRMFREHGAGINQGFLPGSEFQNDEDRRVIATPGLIVRVPIQ